MTLPLFITFFIIFILSLAVIILTIYNRNSISKMTGMMIAMATGMIVGLTVGVILGIFLTGDLYSSTVLSIIIGVTAGFLAGLPISLLAVLDGTLSGIMGGMMGAMLGLMATPEFQDSLIRMMFMLFIAIVLILFQLIRQESLNKSSNQPFIVLCLFAFLLFIIVYNQLGPII
ncbi:hypothetical protein [Virgibacillus necropolis]|uniref:Uncharacterized protein n=1 Tax=Virgibacillus necropolis TaxID=163877 RepID=A0A221MHF2_9BACI|nr:hypothetical protein [Virgibacillus necropolis]ASN07061.1 hypothetical protein CFK40_19585 [Virgibacillus necropolis]